MLIGSVLSERTAHFVVGCAKALVDSRWAISLLDQGWREQYGWFGKWHCLNFNAHLLTFHVVLDIQSMMRPSKDFLEVLSV